MMKGMVSGVMVRGRVRVMVRAMIWMMARDSVSLKGRISQPHLGGQVSVKVAVRENVGDEVGIEREIGFR